MAKKVAYKELLDKLKELEGFVIYHKLDGMSRPTLYLDIIYDGDRRRANLAVIDLLTEKSPIPCKLNIFRQDSEYNNPETHSFDTLNESLGEEKLDKIKEELEPILKRMYLNGMEGPMPSEVKQLVIDFKEKLDAQFKTILN